MKNVRSNQNTERKENIGRKETYISMSPNMIVM